MESIMIACLLQNPLKLQGLYSKDVSITLACGGIFLIMIDVGGSRLLGSAPPGQMSLG